MIDDKTALDCIHALLTRTVWGPDTCDDIAVVVALTGRVIEDPIDLYPENFDESD